MYNFDAEEAMRVLGLERLLLQRKAMAKRVPKTTKKEKVVKAKGAKMCPLPFIASCVSSDVCQGLSFNHGLFTQCNGSKMESGVYCAKCQSQADKNASGKPDSGCVSDRMSSEFKDSKGRKPSNYAKVIAKLGFTVEQAREAAALVNVELEDSVFAVPEKKSDKRASSAKSADKSDGKRGRPKKSNASVEASSVTDLFAQLATDADDMSEVTTSSAGKAKLSAEEKAAKKAALEEERAAKKAALEADRAAKKAALEAERAAKKEAQEAERAAKKAAEKAEREAKRAAEKAERAAKKAAEKGAKKPKAEAVSAPVAAAPVAVSAPVAVAVSAEQPKAVRVSIVTIDGVQYYRNKETNTILDKKTQEEIGTYDEKNKKIIPFPSDDQLDIEESEDEYDEDDEDEDDE